jgi:hypothetical protein
MKSETMPSNWVPDLGPEIRQTPDFAKEAQMYREFFGRGKNRYQVYPDNWPKNWGPTPLLGVVYADDEFLAERVAYDCGVLPTHFNCTFQPKFKQL